MNDKTLIVAGDGRCDSPGHSASFCTYSLMDLTTNVGLLIQVVHVSKVKNSCDIGRRVEKMLERTECMHA